MNNTITRLPFRFTLMSRIIILIFMVSIIPIFLLIYAIFHNVTSTTREDITYTAMQINDITSSTLSNLLENESSILTALSNTTSLLDYENSSKSRLFITNKLKPIVDKNEFISHIYVKSKFLDQAFSYPDNQFNKLTSQDIDGMYFYKLAQKDKKTIISPPYFDSLSKELVITITSPMLNDSNEFLGVIALDISMDAFSNYLITVLEKYRGDLPLEAMIYLANGNILTSTAGEATNSKLILIAGGHEIINNPHQTFSAIFKDTPYQFYRGNAINGLNFITYIDQHQITQLIAKKVQPLILCILTIFFMSLMIGLFYTTRFLKPLHYIVHTLTKLKSNDLSIYIDTNRIKTKDLLEIATATNELIHHLRHSINHFKTTSQLLIKDATCVDQVSIKCNYYANATLDAISQIKMGAKEQMIQVTNTTNSISKLHIQCQESSSIKTQLSQHATYVSSCVQQGLETCKELTSAINTQRDQLYKLHIKVKDLGEKSSYIAGILTTLQGISKKINLLAFNASIEAARADYHGNGFAIIAHEMQQLADTALHFTQSIKVVLDDNIECVSYISSNMQQVISAQKITETVLQEVQQQFDYIEDATTLVEQSSKNVSAILTEVGLTKDMISEDIQNILNIAHKIISLTHSTEEFGHIEFATLQELLSTSENLTQSSSYLNTQIDLYHL